MYGILISLSILLCILIAEKLNGNKGKVWDAAPLIIVSGILGARIYHVIDYWEYYSLHPLYTLKIWQGGLGIWGGVFGVIIALVISRKTKMLNELAVVAPLGQAIGRWGNYFNNELRGTTNKPLFFYESILDLSLFLILIILYTKTKLNKKNIFIALYLIGYGLIRLGLEPYRLEPWEVNGLNISSTISILCITGAIVYLLPRKKT